MAKVELVLGEDKYPPLEIPAGCTVRDWKELVGQGFLGQKVLYAERLTCHGANYRAMTDDTAVPAPPDQMYIAGPRSILGMLEMALKKKVGKPKPRLEPKKAPQEAPKKKTGWPYVGSYHVRRTIGSGFMGPCVYEADHVDFGTKVALKWPAKKDEVEVLKDIAKKMPDGCLGVPEVLATGRHENKLFMAMKVFRVPLTQFWPRIWAKSAEQRWPVVCILGRLLLRRLEALHNCGYVHCDLSPENILLGRAGSHRSEPHLVDFGLARSYPGGGPLAGEHGSAEWSSVRSAEGGERRFEDDLEALGWIMVNGLYSVLPWFGCLEVAYEKWHLPPTREGAVRQAQFMKRKFLEEGWKTAGEWCSTNKDMPKDLWRFILACQTDVQPPQRPDYAYLASLLGARAGLSPEEAEEEDLKLWNTEYPFL